MIHCSVYYNNLWFNMVGDVLFMAVLLMRSAVGYRLTHICTVRGERIKCHSQINACLPSKSLWKFFSARRLTDTVSPVPRGERIRFAQNGYINLCRIGKVCEFFYVTVYFLYSADSESSKRSSRRDGTVRQYQNLRACHSNLSWNRWIHQRKMTVMAELT